MTGDSALLRIGGTGVVIRLEGFGPGAVPALGGFVFEEVREEEEGGEYTIRLVKRVRALGRVGGRGAVASPFIRHRVVGGEDRVTVRGGTVRLAPGNREAGIVLRGASGNGAGGWQADPFLVALQHALALEGWVSLHAAAFEIEGRRVVVLGPRGAGKTTLCLAVIAAGGEVVSDDWIALGFRGRGELTVVPLRRDLWVREGSLPVLGTERWGEPDAIDWAGRGRWRFVKAQGDISLRPWFRPTVVLRLRKDGRLRDPRVVRLGQAQVFVEILNATSPLFLSERYPEERGCLLPVLTALVARVSAYEVRLGRGLIDRPDTTLALLLDRLD